MIEVFTDEYNHDSARLTSQNRRRRNAIFLSVLAVVVIIIIVVASLARGGDKDEVVPPVSEFFDDDHVYVSFGLENLNTTTLTFHISPNQLVTTSYVNDVLDQEKTNHPEVFQDPHSYQNKAATWLQANPNVAQTSSRRVRQRYALACLYYATNGVPNNFTVEYFAALMVNVTTTTSSSSSTPTWMEETGWLVDENECTWFGVECSTMGYVTKIALPSNGLSGSLPSELAILRDSLEELDLFDNAFHNVGDEGHEWLGRLKQLKVLSIGHNFMEYNEGIPRAIGKLTDLHDLELSDVMYTGAIEEGVFADLTSLQYLNMDGNAFGGSVPRDLTTLTSLEYLHAKGAMFTDDISFVESMSSLKGLWMDDNPDLTGDVSVLEGLVTLEALSLQGTGVSGTIPSFICEAQVHLDCSAQLCGCQCTCN